MPDEQDRKRAGAGPGATDVAVGLNNQGRIQIFLRRSKPNTTVTSYQLQPGENNWSNLQDLGKDLVRACTANNANGTLQLFGTTSDTNAYTIVQDAVDMNKWSSWLSLNPPEGPGDRIAVAAATTKTSGIIYLFGCTASHKVCVTNQRAPNHQDFVDWLAIGGSATMLTASGNRSDGMEVFAGEDGDYIETAWKKAGGTWNHLGQFGDPQPGTNPIQLYSLRREDGYLEVFANMQLSEGCWHIWQGATHWSEWDNLTGQWIDICPFENPDGRMQLMAIGMAKDLWTTYQQKPGVQNSWAKWQKLSELPEGLTMYRITGCKNADGRMQLFSIGVLGLYTCWQTAPNSNTSWSPWVLMPF